LSDGTYSDCTVTVTDTASNSVTLNMSSFTVDTTAPSVSSFILSDTLLKTGDNATVTLVFSEVVVGFSSDDDITDHPNGTLTAMTSSDNITWTGTFTPTADAEAAGNTLSLAASWTDTVGNPGTDNTTSNFEIETKRPTVSSFTFSVTDNTTFTNSDNIDFPGLKPGDNATLTLVFSEVVTNFSSADDITADNVTLATMTSSDNIIWTGIFTPTDNISALNNTLTLADGYTDIAGNTGTGTSAKWSVDNVTSNYVIDTGAAAVSSFSPANNVCIPITDNITVTFDFPMFTTSITSDTSTGCGASIMVSSSDDSGVFFSTPNCVPFPGNPVASDSNKTFTLDPVDNLAYDTTYKFKVTTAVESAFRNNLSNQYESSFTTSPSPYSSVSGLFMAVGSGGKILRSTDNGSSWDIATSCQFSTNLYGITFGNNTFVGVGDSGKIVRSTDNGSSFDNETSPIETNLYGITFGNNTFVAVGYSGKIVRSTDNGSSWDNVTSPTSKNLYGIGTSSNYLLGGSIQGMELSLSTAVTTLAGTGSSGSANGTGTSASFNIPHGITTDGTNLYVADMSNHLIRKIE